MIKNQNSIFLNMPTSTDFIHAVNLKTIKLRIKFYSFPFWCWPEVWRDWTGSKNRCAVHENKRYKNSFFDDFGKFEREIKEGDIFDFFFKIVGFKIEI